MRGCLLVGDFPIAYTPAEFIVRLDEQPWLGFLSGSRPHPNQVPTPFEPRAVQRKRQMPFSKPLLRIALRLPSAAVPDDHRARAIFALRNISLEIKVFDRVVLGADRKPLFADREARAFGDRPAFQDSVDLEPQIVMQPARRVFLNDELSALALDSRTCGLRSPGEIALPGIFFEGLPRSDVCAFCLAGRHGWSPIQFAKDCRSHSSIRSSTALYVSSRVGAARFRTLNEWSPPPTA